MNGIQWIIDNKDTAWAGVDESLHGIDIISLSWGLLLTKMVVQMEQICTV